MGNKVLILIILEYIYIQNERPQQDMGNKVLILIILEYIYIKKSWKSKNEIPYGVLILIILEYIYIKLESEMLLNGTGLNPYYTGIHLHFILLLMQRLSMRCLNPYYTGIHLHILIIRLL